MGGNQKKRGRGPQEIEDPTPKKEVGRPRHWNRLTEKHSRLESKTEGYGRKGPIKESETERIRTIRLADVINCLENTVMDNLTDLLKILE